MIGFLRKLFGFTRLRDSQRGRDAAMRESLQHAVQEYQHATLAVTAGLKKTRRLTYSEARLKTLPPNSSGA